MSAATVSETQQRFLRDVVERIPLDRIVELHLFAPIKQGGTETGVAVLAALQPVVEEELVAEGVGSTEADASVESGDTSQVSTEPTIEPEIEIEIDEAPPVAEANESADSQIAIPEFDPTPDETVATRDFDEPSDVSVPIPDAHHQLPLVRHVVLTARYRLILKGPDRGKWEMDIREEADATLVTVDAVVRGVQKRVGDLAEVERLNPGQLAVAVSDTPWRSE